MEQTVVGIFDYTSEAQEAVGYLVDNGFNRSNIDLSTRAETQGNLTEEDGEDEGISGFFSNLFSSDNEESEKYSQVGGKGAIVTVHTKTDQEAENAAKILDNYGAIDVNERAETYKSAGKANADQTGSIKIIEEQLQVGKKDVEAGGVRLRSRIVNQAVSEDVRLRSERVVVSRTDVNRPATDADLAGFGDSTIEMIEHKEVPVVSKQAFVTGEVSLGKEVDETTTTVNDTVRKTEVDTEEITDRSDKYTDQNGTSTDKEKGFYK